MAAFAWVGVLRRRVQKQTEIISQKLVAEAALKERYVDLFENANDIVYTHDLSGRITSINQAGERLLQRSREELLSQKLVDLVLPEQRGATQDWIEQVLQGVSAPAVEWDFGGPGGQPIKLEISARLIEQNGRKLEVEGIARDVTERKRLERELLDISTREQRRIGHDLHDGVCQQLVGIGYLTETLAEKLQEKFAPETADAERISYLLNNTILQTRGVARGLFPVRLEENGLVSALEEFSANAGQLFQLACRFVSERPPQCVDNAIALHLFYIAQEGVANAAKHGKAKNVTLSLEPANDRYALVIEDDGVGFASGSNGTTGMGMRIMHYRARVIGATLEIKSQPGKGTRITCLFTPTFVGSTSGAAQSGLLS
jgi:two-component system CheB/CheR fusion protein